MRTKAAQHPLETGRFIPGLLVAALSSMLAVGCNSLPDRPGAHTELLMRGTLESIRPVDVAVAPITNLSSAADVPEEALRTAFHEALVKRRYSSLSLEYVDLQVVEASYVTGSADEDACLRVEIRNWDT